MPYLLPRNKTFERLETCHLNDADECGFAQQRGLRAGKTIEPVAYDEALAARLREKLQSYDDVTEPKMFGGY